LRDVLNPNIQLRDRFSILSHADKNDTSELIKAKTQDAQQNHMSNKKKKVSSSQRKIKLICQICNSRSTKHK
jgi:hypothetical protein